MHTHIVNICVRMCIFICICIYVYAHMVPLIEMFDKISLIEKETVKDSL